MRSNFNYELLYLAPEKSRPFLIIPYEEFNRLLSNFEHQIIDCKFEDSTIMNMSIKFLVYGENEKNKTLVGNFSFDFNIYFSVYHDLKILLKSGLYELFPNQPYPIACGFMYYGAIQKYIDYGIVEHMKRIFCLPSIWNKYGINTIDEHIIK